MLLMVTADGGAQVEKDVRRAINLLAKPDTTWRAFELSIGTTGMPVVGKEAKLDIGNEIAQVKNHHLMVGTESIGETEVRHEVAVPDDDDD